MNSILAAVSPSGWVIHDTAPVHEWQVYENRTFRVYSDAGRDAVFGTIDELEAIRLAANRLVKLEHPEEGSVILVVLFDSAEEFRKFSPSPKLNSYTVQVADSFAVVLSTGHSLFDDTNFKHQFADRALGHLSERYPSWYREGVAEVVSTLAIGEGVVTTGSPARARWENVTGLIEFDTLITKEFDVHSLEQGDGIDAYAQLWLLIHFTLFGENRIYLPALERYLGLLQRGAVSKTAFQLAFGMPANEYGLMAFEKYQSEVMSYRFDYDEVAKDLGNL